LPVFCYATWGATNTAFQKEHFGRLIMEGDSLMIYCFWRAGLNENLGKEWDAMLAGLKPGKEAMDTVAKFSFPDGAAKSEADAGRKMILEGLEEKRAAAK
jgi:hypothetical protein